MGIKSAFKSNGRNPLLFCYENEKRVAFGLRPLPELEGVRMQSLNYVNVEIAAKYQIGRQQEAAPGSTGGGTGKQRG